MVDVDRDTGHVDNDIDKEEQEMLENRRKLIMIGGVLGIVVLLVLGFAVFKIPEKLAALVDNIFHGSPEETVNTSITQTEYTPPEIEPPKTQPVSFQEEETTTPAPEVRYLRVSINNDAYKVYSREVNLTMYAENAAYCRLMNDHESWTDWFPFEGDKMTKSWTLSEGYGNKTVYFQCKNADGKLSGVTSDTVEYVEVEEEDEDDDHHSSHGYRGPPYDLSLVIGDGSSYINHKRVTLHLSAKYAEECMIWGTDGVQLPWFNYTDEVEVKLQGNDGIKYLHMKCRNKYGESDTVVAMVYLDTTPPERPELRDVITTNGFVTLKWDGQEDNLIYIIYRDRYYELSQTEPDEDDGYKRPIPSDTRVDNPDLDLPPLIKIGVIGKVTSEKYTDRTVRQGEDYEYWIVPMDQAGNVGPKLVVEVHVPTLSEEISRDTSPDSISKPTPSPEELEYLAHPPAEMNCI